MNTIVHKGLIYEFHDFLSNEEQHTLLEIVKDQEIDWNSSNSNYWKGKNADIYHNIMESIDSRVKSLFENYTHINVISSINRFLPGHNMGEHVDEVGHNQIQYGVVIYINDDFNGGEICYPTLDLVHKPVARSLIIHPGNLPHLVNDVLDGPTRYSITTFVHGTKENPAKIK